MLLRSRSFLVFALGLAGACDDGSGHGRNDEGDDGPVCMGGKCDNLTDPTSTVSAGPDEGWDEGSSEPRADLGVSPPAQCDGACTVLADCLGEALADCQLDCTLAHDDASATSADCASAHDALLSCIASLDCAGAADYQLGGEASPCVVEENAAIAACSREPSAGECDGLCALAVSCGGGDAPTCNALCSETLANAEMVGAQCKSAQVTVFECVAALDCESFAVWAAADGDNYPCATDDAALVAACTQAE